EILLVLIGQKDERTQSGAAQMRTVADMRATVFMRRIKNERHRHPFRLKNADELREFRFQHNANFRSGAGWATKLLLSGTKCIWFLTPLPFPDRSPSGRTWRSCPDGRHGRLLQGAGETFRSRPARTELRSRLGRRRERRSRMALERTACH